MADIFISYAREDRAIAGRIADGLMRRDQDVWWDREIPPGESWEKFLVQELARAKVVIVLWSAHSIDSIWVKAEAREAAKRDALVPAMLGEVTPPLDLAHIQAAPIAGNDGTVDETELVRLLDAAVARVVRTAGADAPVDETLPAPEGGARPCPTGLGRLGRYLLIRKLGEGGMGVVYEAQHELLGHRAAIKQLVPELSQNPDVVRRFFNEAKAAASINDPGIVQILDFGHAPDGNAYIVMEFLHGESLGERLAARGRLPVSEAVRLVRQAAHILTAAHNAGIVHRDLKPDNLFIVSDRAAVGGERVKILDFGIAKLMDGDTGDAIRTSTGVVMGSPLYMAPEQCRGASSLDARADVYALGCVLYHLVAGRPPFTGEGVGEVLGKHQYEEPTPPREHNPEIAPALEHVILRAMEKAAPHRFASMDALVAALDELPGSSALSPDHHRRPWVRAASAAVAFIAVAGVAYALVPPGETREIKSARMDAGPPDAAPPDAPLPQVDASDAAVAAPDAQRGFVVVVVSSRPQRARVYTLDGAPVRDARGRLARTPARLRLPRHGRRVTYELRLDHYEAAHLAVDPRGASPHVVELRPQQPIGPARPDAGSRPDPCVGCLD